jgi:predicted metalloprotease
MRLDDAPESGNVIDSRGIGGKLAIGGGAAGIVLAILGLIFGVDLGGGRQAVGPSAPPDQETLTFTKKVLGATEQVWTERFRKMGKPYRKPQLELFSDRVRTGCGVAPSEVGPFYCPADEKVYIDPSFFNELEQKLGGSKADFSKAYVIAHEVGHHVQKLLGYSERVQAHDNKASVRLELQADYLAGVWAHYADRKYRILEPGDVAEAIKTTRSIGDDRLQKRAGGFVHPEKFTHGTAEQRTYFFLHGLKDGDDSKETLDKFFEVPLREGQLPEFLGPPVSQSRSPPR